MIYFVDEIQKINAALAKPKSVLVQSKKMEITINDISKEGLIVGIMMMEIGKNGGDGIFQNKRGIAEAQTFFTESLTFMSQSQPGNNTLTIKTSLANWMVLYQMLRSPILESNRIDALKTIGGRKKSVAVLLGRLDFSISDTLTVDAPSVEQFMDIYDIKIWDDIEAKYRSYLSFIKRNKLAYKELKNISKDKFIDRARCYIISSNEPSGRA